ncbi:hypothetical protein EMCRGX_G025489 [Ephydatia muelleri]
MGRFVHLAFCGRSAHFLMERKLFGRTEEEKQRLNEIKSQSIAACDHERAQLKRCFRESWFGWCSKEQKTFWECFLKEREQLLLKDQVGRGVHVPDNHWDQKVEKLLPSPDTASR